MIVSQRDLDLIRNPRIRQRVLEVPVRHGRFGELKACPMKPESVYRLRAPSRWSDHKARAAGQPTRARAVLWLIDQCETPRTQLVTVTSVERQENTWLVRFVLGDRSDLCDRDVFLARHNDFTMAASRQTVRGDPPVMSPLAEDMRRAREKAREQRTTPHREEVKRLHDRASTLASEIASMKTRNRLRLAAKELARAEAELAVDSGGTLTESDRAARQTPADVEDGLRPRGTDSSVSLGTAA